VSRRAREIDAATRDRLVVAVRRVCPPWLRDSSDDLVQTAVMKLLRSTVEIESTDAYLSRVAYTVVIDEIRRRKRRREVGLSPSLPERLRDSGELSPEARARGDQIGKALLACLQSLSADRRRAVALYLQDHSVPEIAELLGWDAKKASNMVYRGLGDLRTALARRGIGP
jgi:RNA polymerase sigma-70 factor, ECF subfamily